MARYTVRKGKRYRAQVSLSLFQQIVSNAEIARRFTAAGFAEVIVSGRGRQRVATGLWPSEDATAEIPPQVKEIVELEVA